MSVSVTYRMRSEMSKVRKVTQQWLNRFTLWLGSHQYDIGGSNLMSERLCGKKRFFLQKCIFQGQKVPTNEYLFELLTKSKRSINCQNYQSTRINPTKCKFASSRQADVERIHKNTQNNCFLTYCFYAAAGGVGAAEPPQQGQRQKAWYMPTLSDL